MSFNSRITALGCIASSGILTYFYFRNKNYSRTREETVATASLFISNKSFIGSPLTGKSIKDITDSTEKRWQKKLKVNLMYAHEALLHTSEVLPEGAVNYREDLQGISIDTIIKIDNMRQDQDWKIKHTIHPHHNFDKIYEVVADIAKKYKIGNCGEQVAVAYLYLKYEKNLRKVDRLCLVRGDHGFVVIGRDPMSDVSNPSTWGKAAVVCDPWGKRYFPAEQLFDQLNKLSQRTIYDPNVHTIGWTSFGDVPPEVSIYQGLHFHQQRNKRQFAERVISAWSGEDTLPEKILKSCLIDYIERKAKPKVPPLLSERERQKVESEWLRYLHQDLQQSTNE